MSDSTWSTPLLYLPAAISRRFVKTGLVPEGALNEPCVIDHFCLGFAPRSVFFLQFYLH